MAIDKRTLVGNIGLAISLTVSGVYQPWLAKYLGHWKTFNWAIFSQMMIIFLVPFLLPESCRWLMSKGRAEKTINILKKIAKTNKKEVPDEVYESVKRLCEEQKKKKYKSIYKSYSIIFNYPFIEPATHIWIFSKVRR